MFASTRQKQQKYFRQLQCQEHCTDHIPYFMKQECSVIVRWCDFIPLDFVINSFSRLSERQRT